MDNISLNDIQEYLPLLVNQANVDQIKLFPSGFIPVSLNHEADTISSNKDEFLNAIQQKLPPPVAPPPREEEVEEESDEKVIDESDIVRLKETSQRLRDNLALFQMTLKQIPETQLDFLERLSAQENSHEGKFFLDLT